MRISLRAWMLIALLGTGSQPGAEVPPLPQNLQDTGLYVAGSLTEAQADVLSYTPQYPLWSDGATKRRWIRLPAGTAIDAVRPTAWEFPPGTRFWKEFSVGRHIETRLIERLEGGNWRFATYVWNEAGTDAVLAPEAGVSLEVADAPGGRYVVPSEPDCRACHEGAAVPILGFSALQLSPDRDPLAPHAEQRRPGDTDLRDLVARGLLRNVSGTLLSSPPRIAASSPVERAALGYLQGNCGHCHNRNGAPPPVDLTLAQEILSPDGSEVVLDSLVGARARYRAPGLEATAPLIDPGHPERSVLMVRLRSRDPRIQMPPLGTAVVDREAVALIEQWITQQRRESSP